MVWTQAEAGHGCPISMTYACVPALRHAPDLAAALRAAADRGQLRSRPARRPSGKAGLLAGMAMTEKQGGSDVRANTTTRRAGRRRQLPADRAQVVLLGADVRPVPGPGPGPGGPDLLPAAPGAARRQPQRDAHPAAQGQAGQHAPTPPPRSSTTGAVAWPVGEPGRGVATIIEMVSATRLDCVLGQRRRRPAGAACRGRHHARHRSAFGAPLIDQPAMTAVIADLTLESEAATTLAMRLAGAADRAARGRCRRGGTAAAGAARRQVLDLQADADDHRRGAGVPGRQRLRRGIGACRGCCGTRR